MKASLWYGTIDVEKENELVEKWVGLNFQDFAKHANKSLITTSRAISGVNLI